MFFKLVSGIANQACGFIDKNSQCTLEDIACIFSESTNIDEVEFIGYNCNRSNPIWGSFRKYQKIVAYRGEIDTVEIRYANHLSSAWRRFVVTKELCHSLEADKGYFSVENQDVKRLITELSISSIPSNGKFSRPFSMERRAELAALEILLPFSKREQIIQQEGTLTESRIEELAEQFDAPVFYTAMAFSDSYISIARHLFSEDA
ncbi:MAG: ImmA/IrrE family metallo-endopeptidase [Fulvimarina manganoxydans]|uniref:ImmA/IrrE family metallo-endopeptidase n=1 Tax=Fulvimarina manganoxydans TaxID=937218 RepID=UPI00235470F8|nr:ImmA/IrrE family metallo-endopeptidase [Fulvimarina manganoxydans]MCK5932069.1 ImmA/IrrE family metallo-endopeptidase [Fulvimarina manganoxydans]